MPEPHVDPRPEPPVPRPNPEPIVAREIPPDDGVPLDHMDVAGLTDPDDTKGG